MRDRLLYAITTCREIDTDFVVPPNERGHLDVDDEEYDV
jgi:hypothetical protein